VIGSVDLMRFGGGGADEAVEDIRVAADRAAALTRQLLAFGRRQILQAVRVDVAEVVAAMQPLLRRLVPEDVVLRVVAGGGPCPISVDPAQLEQVLLNLVANARDALPGGGTITMSASPSAPAARAGEPDLPPEAVWLTVADDGEGMSEEVKAHLFEPFFTTKEPSRGTGLGLATVHGIVAQSGGRIFVDSLPGRGTSFAIVFPRADGQQAAHPAPQPVHAAPPEAPGTVLLVEDDPAVRAVASAILVSARYRVLQASGGAEALAASDGADGAIDLVLTDVVMQGMSGPAVAARLRQRRPDIKVLYTSGHAEELIAQRGVLRPGVNFLGKPFTRTALLEKVRAVIASPERGDLGVESDADALPATRTARV
jgi:CheY-like chemotaxis protein